MIRPRFSHAAPGGGPVRGLSHVAIATPAADALADTLVASLGAVKGGEELLDGGTLRVVFVHAGPVTFELLEPVGDTHTVAKFLAQRGPGLHHVSLEVDGIQHVLDTAKAAGARRIDEEPRPGAHGTQVAFLHPKSFGGVLLELCDSPERRDG